MSNACHARDDDVERIEAIYRAWFEAHAGVPGMVVRSTAQLTSMVGPGVNWSNCAVRLRLTARTVERTIARAAKPVFDEGRGFGLWVSDLAEPADIAERLTRLGFRKRKRFPGMIAELRTARAKSRVPAGIAIRTIDDRAIFTRVPHPYFGPITTAIRCFEMKRLSCLLEQHPTHAFELGAFRKDTPVGALTLFVSGDTAAFFDVGVLETARNAGIGTTLMESGCALAKKHGARHAILLSSGMGYGMYLRAGFVEACRIAYWYAAAAPGRVGRRRSGFGA